MKQILTARKALMQCCNFERRPVLYGSTLEHDAKTGQRLHGTETRVIRYTFSIRVQRLGNQNEAWIRNVKRSTFTKEALLGKRCSQHCSINRC